MRTVRAIFGLGLTALAACEPSGRGTEAPAAAAGLPDVVLISIDSLRADHLGCYGYSRPTSPAIDELAARGARFAVATSTTSWTLPAHAALFTGQNDSTHGLVDNGLRLDERRTTLAEALAAAGYRTAGFYGGPYLHPVYGLDQGFDRWVSCMSVSERAQPEQVVRDVLATHDAGSHADVTGPRTLAAVRRWLERDDERPFFLFVHLWDVHYDYIPPPEYARMFDPDYDGSLDASNLMSNPAVHAGMPARDREHLVALYDAEIRFTDDVVRDLLAMIEERGDAASTLVVLTADHGEEFFEHGGKGHQRSLFEEVVRVPLLVAWPGRIDAGTVVPDPVRLIDVAPTILALLGVADPLEAQGRDLSPLLAGGELPPAPALLELLVDGGEIRALRRSGSKVVRTKGGALEFAIDLERDPREQSPLGPPSPLLRAGLQDLEREVAAALARARELGPGVRPIRIDAELERLLRGFGYTGGSPQDDER